MVKELITVEMERDSLQQKWGFTVQGGKDVSLTAKIASVKVHNWKNLRNWTFRVKVKSLRTFYKYKYKEIIKVYLDLSEPSN